MEHNVVWMLRTAPGIGKRAAPFLNLRKSVAAKFWSSASSTWLSKTRGELFAERLDSSSSRFVAASLSKREMSVRVVYIV